MSYELNWHALGRVLHLVLRNDLPVDEMEAINQQIMDIVDNSDRKVAVLIDISDLVTGYNTVDHLRSTQQYMYHRNVDAIVVITNNKLNRLITLLVFNLAQMPLFQLDSIEAAFQLLARRGFGMEVSSAY